MDNVLLTDNCKTLIATATSPRPDLMQTPIPSCDLIFSFVKDQQCDPQTHNVVIVTLSPLDLCSRGTCLVKLYALTHAFILSSSPLLLTLI